ncbi:FIM1 [Symbiodinium sp. KB8]|nr:FIM1 [Symbiodinium sp. KB8]
MRHHVIRLLGELSDSGKRIDDAQIISWANKKATSVDPSIKIRDFKDKSLSNGVYFLNVLKAIEPRIINEELDAEMNAKYVISVARKLGALVFLTWEDITDVRQKMIMYLVGSLMHLSLKGSEKK